MAHGKQRAVKCYRVGRLSYNVYITCFSSHCSTILNRFWSLGHAQNVSEAVEFGKGQLSKSANHNKGRVTYQHTANMKHRRPETTASIWNCRSRWLSWMRCRLVIRSRGFDPRWGRQHSFVEIDHELFSTVILSLPLNQEGQLSVYGEEYTILVNRLED